MIKIGITGGIGSGKSTVVRLFEIMGFPVYTADIESGRLTETSCVIREKLRAVFGDAIYRDGSLDKSLLASLIFGNKDRLRIVNSIIHPVVFEDFKKWAEVKKQSRAVIVESAILFESGFNSSVDFSVGVCAPVEVRTERVIKRDGVSKEAVLARICSQMSDEERNRLADFVIINDNSHSLLKQVEILLKSLHL
jgi:dephospho-CoA kinase